MSEETSKNIPGATTGKPKKKFVHPKKSAEERKQDKEKRRLKKARIVLHNLKFSVTEDDLTKEYSKYGPVKECNIVKNVAGKSRGFAFIQYDKVNNAKKAIHHGNGKEFCGKSVYIDWAVGKKTYLKHVREQKQAEKVKVKTEDGSEDMEIKQEDDSDAESDEEAGDEEASEVSEQDDEDMDEEEEEEASEDDEAENDSDEDVKDEKKPIHTKSNDVAEGCTVFIKNIPFECDEPSLFNVCKQFGRIKYVRITKDKITGHSKGNGFVKYEKKESADMCLNAGTSFKLLDQILDPLPALSRNEILQKDESKKKQPRDSRNLYLAKEGTILAGTPAAEGVSASDLSKRLRLEQTKNQSLKNLNRFVSMERLTVHNIPPSYDATKLRKVIVKACGLKPKECRIMRENKPSMGNPLGKSKGFGFLSFKNHTEALNCLRKVNNNPHVFGKNNRPIVAFSIEDKAVHNIKQKRMLKSQQKNPLFKKNGVADVKPDVKPSARALKKLKKAEKNAGNEQEVATFAGTTAEKGSKFKTRPNWKLRDDSASHTKTVKAQKKMIRKTRELKAIRAEKRQIERPKMGKKNPRDVDSSLVNKYLKMLHSKDGSEAKPKRSKWYND